MPIELDNNPGHEQLPTLKIPDVGDSITGHIIDTNTVDLKNFDTRETETYADGNPVKQKVITLIVHSTTGGAKAREDGNDIAATPGLHAVIFTGKGGFYGYREGLQAHGPVQVGDILTWSTDSEDPPKQKGFNGFKRRSYTFARNTDPQAVAAAETAHLARKDPITIEDGVNPNEEPF